MATRRTWVNIAVRPCLHSSLAHNKLHLFENQVWEIFIKKCIHSFIEVVITDYVLVNICVAIQHYLTHSWEDKGIHTFPNGIFPKVNVIPRLEFELAHNDSAVQPL